MIKSKKQMYLVIASFVLILLLGTVTYAFFNYTRTGSSNVIRVGRISFVSRNEQTITLNNLFPIDPTDTTAMNDNTKVGTYSIDITGDTDYSDGIEYLVSAVDANIYTSTGKIVPISLDVTVNGLGTPNANYFTARDSKNANIYKKLVGDILVGDQMLLVGYIKSNTTSGTAEGVNGSITIKAYLDKNNILISDTYDGTESDNMGTLNSLAQGKTVLTTTEWNALQNSGVSFKVRVEANEGIWVNGSLEEIMKKSAVMDNVSSTYVGASTGIDFGAISSDTNGKGVYMRAGTENDAYPIMYYRGEIDDNNVVFANQCWKAVRTTDTGGVKLIYNGKYTEQNKCNNAGTATQISLNIGGTDRNSFSFSGDYLNYSPAYVGYMYGDVYEYDTTYWRNDAKFGSSFTWNGTNYKLVDGSLTTPDATHHYSCNRANENETCTYLRYVYYLDGSTKYYVTLTDGDGIEEALIKMQTNTTDSNAKNKIDTWYASNMSEFTNKLEDTIWCNDRSFGDNNNNGWIANGGDLSTYLYYGAAERSNFASNTSTVKNQPSLACANKNDRFTVNNGNGNRSLTYPIAMLTEDEMVLVGGVAGSSNSEFYLKSGKSYWTLSPYIFSYYYAKEFYWDFSDYLSIDDVENYYNGLRPAISIKPGQLITNGTGTVADPYIIE